MRKEFKFMLKFYKSLFLTYFIISSCLMCYVEVLQDNYSPVLNSIMYILFSGIIIFSLTYLLINNEKQENECETTKAKEDSQNLT